jgi:glycosyltransferase involved in cell wall biosynthesis
MTDWELILIDDGSTDGTAEILEQISLADSRITLIRQQNTGLTRALIHGCCAARGPIIARQDADDISLPRRLEQQYELLSKRPDVGFVSCFADYIGPCDEYLSTVTRPANSDEVTKKLLDERLGPPAHGTVMFRKCVYDHVGGYRPQFYYAQDSDLWMRMAEASQIAYVQESGYQFRCHESSISGSGSSLQSEFGRLGQLCRKARKEGQSELPWLEEAEKLRESIVRNRQKTVPANDSFAKKRSQLSMAYLIGSQLVANKDSRARSYLLRVLRHQPWHWKAWVRLGQSLLIGGKRTARDGKERQ